MEGLQENGVLQILEPFLNSLSIAEDKQFFKRATDSLLVKLPEQIDKCPQVNTQKCLAAPGFIFYCILYSFIIIIV